MPRLKKYGLAGAALALATVLVASASANLPASAESKNLAKNGGFSRNTAGWYSSTGANVRWLANGHVSTGAAEIANRADNARTSVLNDRKNSVRHNRAGSVYNVSAWVRTNQPNLSVGLRLMEIGVSASPDTPIDYEIKAEKTGSVNLTDTAWHEVRTRLETRSDGSEIDVNVLAWRLPHGQAFEVDSIQLTAEAPEAPVWADEFNGTTVDLDKWNVRNHTYMSYEQSCLMNDPRNVAVANGVLTIKARRERVQCTKSVAKDFTSGFLDTIGKNSWTHGRFEMRAKLPIQANTSDGLWPGFWLRPDDGGYGEVDILEATGSGSGEKNMAGLAHQAIHHDYVGSVPHQNSDYFLPDGKSLSDGFHIYRLDWSATKLTWYVDGVKVWERSPETTSWFSSSFNKPYNIRLNMQVGGMAGDPDEATDFSKGFEVDYVRVYK